MSEFTAEIQTDSCYRDLRTNEITAQWKTDKKEAPTVQEESRSINIHQLFILSVSEQKCQKVHAELDKCLKIQATFKETM